MPEHLLYAAQVGTALDQIRCEGMAHVMGMQTRVKAHLGSPLFEDASQAIGRHRVSACGDEECVAAGILQKSRTPLSHVTVHGFERDGVQRDDALLGTLAKETDARIREIDVSKLETGKLGNTGATRIE